jgi:hypothetical protein
MTAAHVEPAIDKSPELPCSEFTGGATLDASQKRAALIEHLESARGIASELGDATTEYLIERALDQARADQIPGMAPRNAKQGSAPPSIGPRSADEAPHAVDKLCLEVRETVAGEECKLARKQSAGLP